jgi:5-methylcytosine-specific restriction endonuclease McrA
MSDDAQGLAALRVLILWYRERYPLHCFYCGKPLRRKRMKPRCRQVHNDNTMDHVTPQSAGGTNDSGNKVPCCFSCNNRKDDLMPEKFRQKVAKAAWLIGGKFFGERQYANSKH